MGCGVSSGTQIQPMRTELPVDVKNGTRSLICSKSNSIQSLNEIGQIKPNSGFKLRLLFPCRLYGTNSPTVTNTNLPKINFTSIGMQTESDILGFKSQYSQTDTQILSDEEFESMVEELETEIKKIEEECQDKKMNGHRQTSDDEGDDDFVLSQKKWKKIIKSHRDEFDNEKRCMNIAIQATRPKSTSATQTKLGSIDHQFVPKSNALFSKTPQAFLEQNELLSKALSENLCKVIAEPSSLPESFNQHLTTLLTSFDDNDEEDKETLKSPLLMVNSIEKTLDGYTSECENKSDMASDQVEQIHSNTNGSINSNGFDPIISIESRNKDPATESSAKRKLKYHLSLLKQQKFQQRLQLVLDDIRHKTVSDDLEPLTVSKRDVSLQTTNDILTDEAPEYAARPPLCHKNEMIPSFLMFRDIDQRVQEAPTFNTTQEIVEYVQKHTKNDLFRIRGLFVWITSNIKHTLEQSDDKLMSTEIIQQGYGTSQNYCQLFGDLCRIAGIRVKKIEGFVREHDYRPGLHFKPGEDTLHSWNAVYVLSSWRFIDLARAAGFTDGIGQFHPSLNERYFLTDPNVMIWTHFPYNQLEESYERWQLLDKPLTLDQFNALPKVNESFFDYNLSVRSKIQNALEFRISTEIKIGSHEAMRYKYKLYPAEEMENSSLNHYVFCQLKEDRLVGSFVVSPPLAGRFHLKIFAKPERDMHGSQQDLSVVLDPVITMALDCTKARKYIEPFPINDLPWGPTQKFYDYKLKLINQKGPIIVTWGGKRRLVMESNETMLITYSIFDAESMEMDVRSIISRDDQGLKTTFTINPPRVGTFKLMLFGMPKPKQKGKWRIPLLATFMIDCKLIKPPQHDEDFVPTNNNSSEDSKNNGKK